MTIARMYLNTYGKGWNLFRVLSKLAHVKWVHEPKNHRSIVTFSDGSKIIYNVTDLLLS